MEKQIGKLEVARVSSKGQLVIPQSIREKMKIEEGSMVAVTSHEGLVVLKKIEKPISKEDVKTLRLVEEAWDDIGKGRYRELNKEDFLKELGRW